MVQGTDVLPGACGVKRVIKPVRVPWMAVCVLGSLTGLLAGEQARAAGMSQAEAEARKIVIFKGSVLQEPTRRLSVRVNDTLLIKTEVACKRAEARPEGIVTPEVLTPYEIVVTGKAPGNASLRLFTEDGETPVFQITVAAAPAKLPRDAKAQPFKASLRVAPVQRLSLKLNKSMLIQTNFPCRRVQALSPALAAQKDQTQVVRETETKGDKSRSVTRQEPMEAEGKHKDIIQAEIITPTEILIVAKWFGMTQLLLFTEDNRVQILEVTVEADVERLNEVIAKEFPGAEIRAKSVLGAIVLEGEVPDSDAAKRIMEIAQVFAKGEGQIKDHMTVREEPIQQLERIQLMQLSDTIAKLAPTAKVQIKKVMGTLVLHGRVPDVETAERLQEVAAVYASASPGGKGKVINHLEVAGVQQVLLRCTVAEVSKQALRELGINGWLAGDNVRDMFLVQQLDQINPANIGAAADALVAPAFPGQVPMRVPFLTGTQGIPLQPNVPLSIGFPRVQMQLFINALRSNSLVRILAEPNLVAISGQNANFRVGGEYAYPVPQEGGVPAVDFKEFGISLSFTPTVLANQRIRLRIMPEVSNPDDTIGTVIQNTAVPGKSTRQLETVVEIGNGQTLALAGLLNEQVRGTAQKIPGLGDIPVLGALFSSVRYQKNLTELLVLCTPELISPLNPDQVPSVPGEEMTSPNDWQLFGLGQLEGVKRPVPSDPERALKTAQPVRTYKLPRAAGGGVAQLQLQGPWGVAEGNESE